MEEERKLTKKEQKALRRLEREQKELIDSSNSPSKVKWFVIGFVALLFVGFFGYMVMLSKQKKAENAEKALSQLTENGTVRGNKNAKVTLVEFGDIQCPSCQAAHPIVKDALADMKDVKLVFKHFPLVSIHPHAMTAAKAAEAAGKQGKFWQMTDLLYEKQGEWASVANVQPLFEGYAESIGLNVAQFKKDMKDPAIAKKIESERDEGISIGVPGTPTFYVNGVEIDNPGSTAELKAILESELKKR